MPPLNHVRHERFAQEVALGKTGAAAWQIASGKRSVAYASAVGRRSDVSARLAELKAEQQALHKKAALDAAARFEVTIERIAGELARIAFANLADYVKFGPDGVPRTDFSKLTFDQSAASYIGSHDLSAIHVSDFELIASPDPAVTLTFDCQRTQLTSTN